MLKTIGLSPELESMIQEKLVALGTDLSQTKYLAECVLRMSDFYIHNPRGSTPWSNRWCQVAQWAYYLPLNYARLSWIFKRHQQHIQSADSLFDFGCGLSPTLFAFEHSWKSVQLWDQSVVIKNNLIQLAQKKSREVDWSSEFKSAPRQLTVFSYSLTEMSELPQGAWSSDQILVLEPSNMDDSKRLIVLRQQALEKGFEVIGPCLHHLTCPLADGQKDWCHFRLDFAAPDWLRAIESYLPFKNQTLTLSYLYLQKPVANKNLYDPTLPEKIVLSKPIDTAESKESVSIVTLSASTDSPTKKLSKALAASKLKDSTAAVSDESTFKLHNPSDQINRTEHSDQWSSENILMVGDLKQENGKDRILICMDDQRKFLTWMHKDWPERKNKKFFAKAKADTDSHLQSLAAGEIGELVLDRGEIISLPTPNKKIYLELISNELRVKNGPKNTVI